MAYHFLPFIAFHLLQIDALLDRQLDQLDKSCNQQRLQSVPQHGPKRQT
jgi:hypothetical protein